MRDWCGVDSTHPLDDFAQNPLHIDLWVFGVSHTHISTVEINGVELTDVVGESARVEIGLDSTDAQDKVGRLDLLANTRIRSRASIHTSVVRTSLIHCSLA